MLTVDEDALLNHLAAKLDLSSQLARAFGLPRLRTNTAAGYGILENS
jgi:hypothetical protein